MLILDIQKYTYFQFLNEDTDEKNTFNQTNVQLKYNTRSDSCQTDFQKDGFMSVKASKLPRWKCFCTSVKLLNVV